jgi:hypothetical protein
MLVCGSSFGVSALCREYGWKRYTNNSPIPPSVCPRVGPSMLSLLMRNVHIQSHCPYICLLASDIIVGPGFADKLVEILTSHEHPFVTARRIETPMLKEEIHSTQAYQSYVGKSMIRDVADTKQGVWGPINAFGFFAFPREFSVHVQNNSNFMMCGGRYWTDWMLDQGCRHLTPIDATGTLNVFHPKHRRMYREYASDVRAPMSESLPITECNRTRFDPARLSKEGPPKREWLVL